MDIPKNNNGANAKHLQVENSKNIYHKRNKVKQKEMSQKNGIPNAVNKQTMNME